MEKGGVPLKNVRVGNNITIDKYLLLKLGGELNNRSVGREITAFIDMYIEENKDRILSDAGLTEEDFNKLVEEEIEKLKEKKVVE